jgi:adenylosuccinate lyase
MTSRDLTECVEQLQVYKSLQLIMMKSVASLGAFAKFAEKYADFPYAARTHNVIAQLTTLGKRLAMFGEDLLHATRALQDFIDSYPVRGLKGAVGTQLDQLTLFEGDHAKAQKLNELVLSHLGISCSFGATGQVYPRSLDFETVSRLYQIGSGPSSFAKTLRIMAGHELAGEGFAKGQTGSSAMPHKMNSRSCERLNGFHVILRGFLEMGASLAGDQWNEGDVSCSVVRRVMLPGSFFAIDGLLETFLTIARQMEINEAVIAAEREKYMPFLLTTTVMMRAVKNGAGREDAHEVIKEHAVATLRDLRDGKIIANDLFKRLAEDTRLPLNANELNAVLEVGRAETGMAKDQSLRFVEEVAPWLEKYPCAKTYAPGDIL